MARRFSLWLVFLGGLTVILLTTAYIVAVRYAGPAAEAVRLPLLLLAFFGSLIFVLALVMLRWDCRRCWLRPVEVMARDVSILLQTKQVDRALRIPEHHQLGDLPHVIDQLVDELRRSRHEAVRAMAAATARVEQEKGWLELILLELIPEGVLVCAQDHRILLYNQPAARLFQSCHTLGLGRSLFDLVADEPLKHALEQLEFRIQSGQQSRGTHFICTSRDAHTLLKARMVLLLDPVGKPTGYVLTLEDISAALAAQVHEEAMRRVVTRDLRGSAANLRAAAENLSAFPDIEPAQRRTFYDILFKESTLLSQHIEKLTAEYQHHSVGVWPMTEIHAVGLLHFLAHRLHEKHGIHLEVVGESHWVHGNSYCLSLVLSYFIEQIAIREKVQTFEIEAVPGRSRMYLELRWQGHPLPMDTLNTWLETPLTALLGATLGEVLERHSSEPWSQARDHGAAVLRIPLQRPAAPQKSDEASTPPPRPEFYDFDLMVAHSFTGALEDRLLKDLTYVVFDTETTGLKPTEGDEIIQIAAIRVTKGRVLSGETFDRLVNPGRRIPKDSIRFHGITDEMVKDQPPITQVLPQFHTFVGDAVLVAHNAAFDMKFLKLKEAQCGIQFQNPVIDSLLLSLLIEGEAENHSLDAVCERLNITMEHRHSALGDAIATAHVLVNLLDRLEAIGIRSFGEAMRVSSMEARLRFRATLFD